MTSAKRKAVANSPVVSDQDMSSMLETMSLRNIHVAVVGNVDAGKSTLIGTLTTSALDDGRGSSRALVTKHKHEAESGRTSTVSSHMLGFKENGDVIARSTDKKNARKTEAQCAREAHKVVTLMDLAGHEKYLKTTIYGVSSGMPDYALILVNFKQPPTHMTMHHLNLCCSFGIPVIVVMTKVDGCPEHVLKNTKAEVADLLRAPEVGRKGYAVRNEHDIETVKDKLHSVAPILSVSCVSGEGLGLLRKLLFELPKRRRHQNKINRPLEYLVEDTFNVTGVGVVVSGFVNAGQLRVGEQVFVGPMRDGTSIKTTIKSMHVAQNNVDRAWAGHSACLALSLTKEQRKRIRKGMVVLKETIPPVFKFTAEICLLKGATMIPGRFQATVHVLHVKQTARVLDIQIIDNGMIQSSDAVLRPGSRARVTFEFVYRPEYVRKGMRLLFRDGHVRGIGFISEVVT